MTAVLQAQASRLSGQDGALNGGVGGQVALCSALVRSIVVGILTPYFNKFFV